MCSLFIAKETRPSWHPLIETAAVAKTTRNQRAIILPRGHERVSANLPRLVASHALDFLSGTGDSRKTDLDASRRRLAVFFRGFQRQNADFRPSVNPQGMLASEPTGDVQQRRRGIKQAAGKPDSMQTRGIDRANHRQNHLTSVVVSREHQIDTDPACP